MLGPDRQALDLDGDLLRVDGVVVDPGAGVGFVVACSLQGGLLVAHLDLEALPRTRLLGDRSQRLECVGLLLHVERRRVSDARQRLDRLIADEPVELCGEQVDLRDVSLLLGQDVLGLRQVR